jgi:hypothetical protein
MKTKSGLLFLGLGLFLTLSCTKYPPDSERLLEDLAIVTQYDTKVDFNEYKTYSISPTITKITDRDTTVISSTDAGTVINEVRKNMDARGFTEVAATANPDFGMQVVYFQNTTVYAYYGGYWGYDWYGYYYPYYPVYYSSYTTGMADVQLIDLKDFTPGSELRYLRWNAYIRGLMTGNHTTSELTGAIDKAFEQTPQLKTTKASPK